MTDKEFFYGMYNKDLVDRAYDATAEFFRKGEFEADLNLARIAEKYDAKTGDNAASRLYNHMFNRMVSSYLHGADFAVRTELGSTGPSEETFSEFHKNVDFAVLFDFSDNDFGLAMEAAAKTYCSEFNSLLRQIDMYDDYEYMRSSYIKEFNEIIKIDNIKEIMRCGFLAQRMQDCAEVHCGRMPKADDSLDEVRSDMNYIPWEGDKSRYECIDGEYKVVGKFPRFITGTNKEIAEALEKYGHPDENPARPFPVWCNGEVIILYMKDGYLKYVIR